MSQTDSKHPTSKNPKTRHNLARRERDLRAYELSLAGISVRGIWEEIGLKSSQSGWMSVERGKKIALEEGIDIEEHRIDINRMFKQTLGMLAKTAHHQSVNGCIETIHGPEGTITKVRQGIDPRIAGELSRSLNRWAEFCGLLDRAPEVNQASTTLIQLAPPSDGASFTDKWSNAAETVDVAVTDHAGLLPSDGTPEPERATVTGIAEDER